MGLRIEIADIWKAYNGNPVLMGCDFSFKTGHTYALMGPNGCGKSTLLRICGLIEEPDRGDVRYFQENTPLKKDFSLKRRITLVLPKIGAFNTTVYKNVRYGLKIRGLPEKAIKEKIEDVLNFVGLINKRTHNALTLSSGEAQRLGIARAIAIEPEILFLDEPTASIDMKNTEIVEEIIMKMKDQKKTTIILTTHDLSQAKRLADIIAVLCDGKLQ